MGFSPVQCRNTMIRTVLLTCLVAAIKADADAVYGYPYAYGAYPYAYGYAAYGVPFGSSTGLDPITQGLDPVTQGAIVKRSADADADAYYGYPYAYGAYPYAYGYAAAVPFGSSTGLDPITQGLDAVTQGVALPYAGYTGHYIGKRSADADAYYAAYPYAYGYATAVPFGSSTGLDPITQGLDAATQ